MAIFTIRVKTDVSISNKPFVKSQSTNDCTTEQTITVPVPSGQTRYIQVDYNNSSASSYVNTINSTTDINLILDGSISNQTNLNTEFSSVTLRVSLTSNSEIYYSKQLTRTHTGNIC